MLLKIAHNLYQNSVKYVVVFANNIMIQDYANMLHTMHISSSSTSDVIINRTEDEETKINKSKVRRNNIYNNYQSS